MVSFKKIDGPYGIPVYYQRLPDIVRSVSFGWTMFVGGADDEAVGAPGLYHWFEHVPFRGTKKYPNGSKDIRALFTKHGGSINAITGPHSTTFHATVPFSVWKEALDIVTDLMAQPLLTDEGINAEREIIIQEIAERKARSWGKAYYELSGILWHGHPFGHHVLGSEDTLRTMDPALIRRAHKEGYDRSRCVFVISGNIDESELLEELEKVSVNIPDHSLLERHKPAYYVSLPKWQKGKTTIQETEFTSSIVLMLFPIPVEKTSLELYFYWEFLANLFTFGATNAPLMEHLREKRKLVYHADVFKRYVPGGGYWGFSAETQEKNIDAVIESFKHVLKNPEVYSTQRIDTVKTGLSGNFDIKPIDTRNYISQAVNRLVDTGCYSFSDEEYLQALKNMETEKIKELLFSLKEEDAHIIVFKGKKI